MQQGLKNAASIFQQAIEGILKGLQGLIVYQDDIMVYGRTEAELNKRFNAVKERLSSRNLTINEKKSVSFSKSVSFLGYEISAEGIKPGSKHVEKLLQLQPPQNVKEVESFIGLINYFGRMIPNYANKTRCINELRHEDKEFKWTTKCQQAFQNEMSTSLSKKRR